MVAENPTWGAPRIHGELLKLRFDISERSVSRCIQRASKNPDPAWRWLVFLRNHRDAIAAMREAAEQLLAPQFRAIVRLIAEPILQPIYDLESPHLAFGRVAIVGDAAFVARPHVAAGVSKAADDAAALAAALDGDDIESSLLSFEAARLPDNRKIIERARHLGAYLQATQTAEERARSARHSIPEAVLAETAMIDFLH